VHVRIRHSLHYEYSRDVYCEPVAIRLRPREDAAQRLVRWKSSIDPHPLGVSEFRDLDGNLTLKAWFEGLTRVLTITSECEVESLCTDPFRFLLIPEATVLPVRVEPIEQSLAAHYSKPGTLSPRIVEVSEDIQRQTGRQTIRFLCALTAHLHDSFNVIVRLTGDPWPAEKTLEQKSGSCRDLAVLFCEICRSAGLPSRFVSGYTIDPDADRQHHLHAWSEVYLPGAGWRGFDPTTGLAVSNRHVALAAARLPTLASPTSGAFRGTGVTSELTASVRVTVDDPDATQYQTQMASAI
jgi:transglutaminase-like putative cysteine protease